MIKSSRIRRSKIAAASFSLLAMSALYTASSNVKADADTGTSGTGAGSATYYLNLIEQHTNQTLQKVNDLPDFIVSLSKLSLSWLSEDDTPASADLQAGFGGLVNGMAQNATTQSGIQQQLLTGFFGADVTTKSVPYANDMTYQTLIGQPYFKTDPRDTNDAKVDAALNYLKNASGMNMTHVPPANNWQGAQKYLIKYASFYTTVSAVQTYDAYVLSQLYAEAKNGNVVTNGQAALIKQASDASWFKSIASENIGVVLRQILMYNSQMYVVMTQLLQTQKQVLAAQVMGNTLLVVGNLYTEGQLYNKAANIKEAP
jgi:hypothetical protein